MVVIGLAHAFGVGRAAAIRTGFYLSQAGELAFVLLGAAAAAGMGTSEGHTLAMLVVAMSMILTPLMVKSGDRLALRFDAKLATTGPEGATALERHVVIVGCDEVGKLISLMLEQADIPHVVFDHDIEVVRKGQRAGRNAHFGDMRDPSTQEAAGLGKAAAVFISSTDMEGAKELAVTLHRLYSSLHVYVRVRSLDDQDELVAKGVKHAGTAYIESTLLRGSMLLKDLGVAEDDVDEIVQAFQSDDRALIRSVSARATK
jgi:glutathione-regulated potassium-efflux system protein KefB